MNSQASLVDQVTRLIAELDEQEHYWALSWIYGMSDDVSSKAIGEIRKVAIDLGLYDADDWIAARVGVEKARSGGI